MNIHPSSQHLHQYNLHGGHLVAQQQQLTAFGFDPNTCRGLYIGNLDPKVTDALLYEIFSSVGAVEGCKVIKDKNGQSSGYGFVDYYDHATADRALQHLNGRRIYSLEIKVNWAHAGSQGEDTSNHFHIFVGDLGPEIDDKALFKAFSAFGSCSDARVMWDQNTQRSRGYGFVAFRRREDAERALSEMNGEWLGNRAIRCNWANQKVTSSSSDLSHNNDYESVVAASPPDNTTVYIGNLAPDVTESLLHSIFHEYGDIDEVRMQKDKGYAFIKYKRHEEAARAISCFHGRVIGPKAVKCAWGKERTNSTGTTPTAGQIPVYPVPPQMLAPTPLVSPTVVSQNASGSSGANGNTAPVPSPYTQYPLVPAYNMYNPQLYNSPQQYYNPHMNPQAPSAIPPNSMYGQIGYQYPQPYFPYDYSGQVLPNS